MAPFNRITLPVLLTACGVLLAALSACAGGAAHPPHAPVLTPDEELATFRFPDDVRVELVAAEPLVQDPVVIRFDEDGRLWVVEMPGFMPDLEGDSDPSPTGRIVVLTDRDGDGTMDERTVFLDGLVLPRALAFVEGGVLVAENIPLWFVPDADRDLRGDSRVLIDSTYGGSGLPEHAGNGLWYGMDNWLYNAKSRYRYRFLGDDWVREETEYRGQWGIAHDDAGRLFYNYNWSQLHADLVPPNVLSRNPHHTPTSGIGVGVATDRRVFPIRPTPAVNRGYVPGALDDQLRIVEFTSASAPLVYRGTALPDGYRGDAFVCEPAGNLIKRNVIVAQGLAVTARPAYPDREFLASSDERFRPVFLAGGPDGALYVADMYRGIIQDGAYMTPYLREQIAERGLAAPIHMGRIWRIVARDAPPPRPAVGASGAPSDTLVARLSDPNGWWRDTAQRLLVQRQALDAVPALEALVRDGGDPRARLHALWTLDGLGRRPLPVLLAALDDPDAWVRAAALRILDPLATTDPAARRRLADALHERWRAAPPEVALAMTLSIAALDDDEALPLLAGLMGRYAEMPLFRDAALSSLRDRGGRLLRLLWDDPTWHAEAPGRAVLFEQLAAAALAGDAPDALLALMPSHPGAIGWREEAVLAGMALQSTQRGPRSVRLAAAPPLFAALGDAAGAEDARLVQGAALFDWPGRPAFSSEPEAVAPLDDDAQRRFAVGRQRYLSVCAACHGADGAGLAPLAPPLKDSEWVTGDPGVLIRIVLHGLEGPVEVAGRRYEPPATMGAMPSLAVMDDAAVAAVATYVRRAWGHTASPVEAGEVGRIRVLSQGRVMPWTVEALRALPLPETSNNDSSG